MTKLMQKLIHKVNEAKNKADIQGDYLLHNEYKNIIYELEDIERRLNELDK